MATIQRNVKTYGTRSFVGEVSAAPSNYAPILANEVDADLDTVYAAWNGGIDTVNVKDGSITYAKLAPDAQLWRDTGTTLTPGVNYASRPLLVPGSAAPITDTSILKMGQRLQKCRVHALPTLDFAALSLNATWNGTSWVRDDGAVQSWRTVMRNDLNQFSVEYQTPTGLDLQFFLVSAAGGPGGAGLGQFNAFLRGRAFAAAIYAPGILPWASRVWAQVPMTTLWINNAGLAPGGSILRGPNFDTFASISMYAQMDANPLGWFFEIQSSPDGSTWTPIAHAHEPAEIFATMTRMQPIPANTQVRLMAYNNDTVAHNITRAEFSLCVLGQI